MSDECPAPLLYVNSSDGDLPGLILICVGVACKAASHSLLLSVQHSWSRAYASHGRSSTRDCAHMLSAAKTFSQVPLRTG